MKTMNKNKHPIKMVMVNSLVNLPTPSSISYMWNLGSLLGIILATQIISGVLLASHYNSSINLAFESTIKIMRNINMGLDLRTLHMNTANMFFITAYMHISRNMLNSSFKLKSTWMSGILLLMTLMATAFLGYVLPWGQMSFWGATVITNLVTAIPMVGKTITTWLWGGFSIDMATLMRFFSLHFLIPLLMMAMSIFHLASLHTTGSNKPTGLMPSSDKIPFLPFFYLKDIAGLTLILSILAPICYMNPLILGDPENFNPANPLNTPPHIQPEWYFLFAYAILRSIPNKLGGVVALIASILALSLMTPTKKLKAPKKFMPSQRVNFWVFSSVFCMLTWIGSKPVENPFIVLGMISATLYFTALLNN